MCVFFSPLYLDGEWEKKLHRKTTATFIASLMKLPLEDSRRFLSAARMATGLNSTYRVSWVETNIVTFSLTVTAMTTLWHRRIQLKLQLKVRHCRLQCNFHEHDRRTWSFCVKKWLSFFLKPRRENNWHSYSPLLSHASACIHIHSLSHTHRHTHPSLT